VWIRTDRIPSLDCQIRFLRAKEVVRDHGHSHPAQIEIEVMPSQRTYTHFFHNILASFRQELHILGAECLTSINEHQLLDPFHSFYNNPYRILLTQSKALKCNMVLAINYDYLHLIVTVQDRTYIKLNIKLT
jgi:hypothetical protein